MPVQVTDGQAVHPASVSRLSCRIFHGQVVPQPVGFYLQDAGAGTLFLPVFPREVSGRFQRALHGDVTVAVYRQHRFAFVILYSQAVFAVESNPPQRFRSALVGVVGKDGGCHAALARGKQAHAVGGCGCHLPVLVYVGYGVYQFGELVFRGAVSPLEVRFQCFPIPVSAVHRILFLIVLSYHEPSPDSRFAHAGTAIDQFHVEFLHIEHPAVARGGKHQVVPAAFSGYAIRPVSCGDIQRDEIADALVVDDAGQKRVV